MKQNRESCCCWLFDAKRAIPEQIIDLEYESKSISIQKSNYIYIPEIQKRPDTPSMDRNDMDIALNNIPKKNKLKT